MEGRFEYSQEKARAALSDRRWRLLVDTMTTWIAQAGHLDAEAKDWCGKALHQVPSPALSRLLADWNQSEVAAEEERARQFIQREIIEQLSVQALSKKDARLARELLESAPPWLRASDVGVELSLLASLAEEEARVSGRLVGMVLGGQERGQRQRSVRAGVGIMKGLNLGNGRLDRDETHVSMIAAEHRGSVRTALASLSGQGAAVLVAAVDPLSAMEALAFAESRRVPVVVLTPPMGLSQLSLHYGFSIGASSEEQQAAMLPSGASRAVLVGTTNSPCPSSRVRPGATSLPLDSWREQAATTVGVLGDASCARRVVRELNWAGGEWNVIFGLEAASAQLPPLRGGGSYSFLTAGSYPKVRASVELDTYVDGEGRQSATAPSWFEVLGEDLAALLQVALAQLPESVTSDPEGVRRLHDRARDALLVAEAELSTTDARGFSGAHRMQRTIGVRRLEVDQ